MPSSERMAACRVRRRLHGQSERVEIGLQVFWAQAVGDPERPGLEVREHAVDPGQHHIRKARARNRFERRAERRGRHSRMPSHPTGSPCASCRARPSDPARSPRSTSPWTNGSRRIRAIASTTNFPVTPSVQNGEPWINQTQGGANSDADYRQKGVNFARSIHRYRRTAPSHPTQMIIDA